MQSVGLPPISQVVNMRLIEAMQLLERVSDREVNDIHTQTQCIARLIEIYKSRGSAKRNESIMSHVGKSLSRFDGKCDDMSGILDAISCFVADKESVKCLNDLDLASTDVWMNESDFETAKTLASHEKPLVLLVAGTTSSGKSTIVNGLLGFNLLPTGHNATTSALCEIKWGATKTAVVHLTTRTDSSGDEKFEPEERRISLENEENRTELASYVSCDRDEKESVRLCHKVEIFWPLPFLKDFTIIDTPGVSEADELSPASRKLTEKCQQNTPCCLIYVINAEQAAEEGAQVGGLLVEMAKKTTNSPRVLFIVNKWDQFLHRPDGKKKEKEKKDEYLKRLYRELKLRWADFRPSHVVTMNSLIGGMAQELGALTSDMESLREGLTDLISQAMKQKLRKALKKPADFLERIEQTIEMTMRRSRLSDKEKKDNLDEKAATLSNFESTALSGKISRLRSRLESRITDVVKELETALLKKESVQAALKWGKSTEAQAALDEQAIDAFVCHRLEKAVAGHPLTKGLVESIEFHIAPIAFNEITNLVLFASGFTSGGCIVSDEEHGNGDGDGDGDVRFEPSVNAKSYSWLPLILGSILFPPLLFVGAVKFVRRERFRKSVEIAYEKAIREKLRQTVVRIVSSRSLAARYLFREFTAVIDRLVKQLALWRKSYKKEDLATYEQVLHRCKVLVSRVSSYLLELGMEDFTDDDVEFVDKRQMSGSGQFGTVYRIFLKQNNAALKVFHDFKSGSETSANILREFNCCKKFGKRKSFLVEFYGFVSLGHPPHRTMALAMEWCGGGTLADEIEAMGTKLQSGRSFQGYKRCVRLLKELLTGVAFLHRGSVVHRDIKPENIMLTTDKQIRIGDFGFTKDREQITGTYCGTKYYMAPEVRNCEPYDTSADVFSIGIIMWEMWEGNRARYDVKINQSRPQGFSQAAQDLGTSREPSASADECFRSWKKLMETCWSHRPSARSTAREALDIVSEW